MAESVDALVSNTSGAIHPGSTPGLGTTKQRRPLIRQQLIRGFYFIRCTKSVLYNILLPSETQLATKKGASASLHSHPNQKI